MMPASLLVLSLALAVPCAGEEAAVKQLTNLSQPKTVRFAVQNKAEASIVAGEKGGHVLRVTCPAGPGYPGVHVQSSGGGQGAQAAWGLTGYAWIAA